MEQSAASSSKAIFRLRMCGLNFILWNVYKWVCYLPRSTGAFKVRSVNRFVKEGAEKREVLDCCKWKQKDVLILYNISGKCFYINCIHKQTHHGFDFILKI